MMTKNEIIFKEETCKSALTRLKRKMPYGWDLNIYRGCQHGCKYCYAVYSHKYLDSIDFFTDIHIKTNIVDELEKELRNNSWKREVVNIGGVTDSYQPVEAKYKLMPEILKLFIKYKTPAIISTKSKLILRDYDLIDELSRITYVNIAETITTMDESVRRKIEPFGATSLERFEVLKEFGKTNASTGLHVMPIIPYITDSYENFHSMFKMASDCKVNYVLPGTLYLRGDTREIFFNFIKEEYTHLYEKLQVLYRKGGASKEYKEKLYLVVNELRDEYNLSSSYTKAMKEKMNNQGNIQISLFDK
ncbi:radical SAM protein [Clostridium sporogenes]|uniref:SPL family radical SAM protein n=1 Tax=Clostridium sporogenes TaxID=1509 RepID=UPI0013D3336E|nr:radical SAM protein [Clostridium sporogenes]MBU5298769.1 radical SAM protein [Clostridium sporogenes]NFP90844.1 radical SAM protein [Clostridium sporogenes]